MTACQGCHADLEDFDLNGAQTEVEALAAELGELLEAAGLLHDGHPNPGIYPEDQAQAAWNYIYIVLEDKSLGAHNMAYTKALLEGNADAMSKAMNKDEEAGLKLFVGEANCIICHNGSAFSDYEFHNVGVPQVTLKKYDFGRKTAINKVKKSPFNCFGEYNDSKDKSCDDLTYIVFDEHITLGTFKTPGLRNISKTAPYMHAGQYNTLADVIGHYVDPPPIKLGENDTRAFTFDLDDKEQQQLEAFLKALDSNIDADARWLKKPL